MFTSPDDVLEFLRPRLFGAMPAAEVATLMAPLSAGSAWVHLGGSGTRQQIFRLEQDLRAVFQFDRGDRLVAYGAYRSEQPWRRDASGALTAPAAPAETELILLTPE